MKSIKKFKENIIQEETITERVVGGLDSATYKLAPLVSPEGTPVQPGRKIRAHRVLFTANDETQLANTMTTPAPGTGKLPHHHKHKKEKMQEEVLEESVFDPPPVLLLKRKAIRMFSNDTRMALYYNDKLNKYFSIPYSINKSIDAPIQAESYEPPNMMSEIYQIAVGEHPTNKIEFENGESRRLDRVTATAISLVYEAVNEDNKNKIDEIVSRSPSDLMKIAQFAYYKIK
jgi:hypothetical protein